MIDQETRFDSGVILPNKVFQYNCTFINYDKASLNIVGLKKDAEHVLLKRVKTDPYLKILRDNKATVIYNYKDKNGEVLFELPFTPNEYLR